LHNLVPDFNVIENVHKCSDMSDTNHFIVYLLLHYTPCIYARVTCEQLEKCNQVQSRVLILAVTKTDIIANKVMHVTFLLIVTVAVTKVHWSI